MGFIQTIKRWFNMIFSSKAKEEFAVKSVTSAKMDTLVSTCFNIYSGSPSWLDEENHIKTINMAKTICEEVARLTTLAIGITIDGSARADYLQKQIDSVYFNLRKWVEYGCACGTIILKPNGTDIDVVLPDSYIVTEEVNGEIRGIVFINQKQVAEKYYTRLEYHRFIDGLYAITNKCFVGNTKNDSGKPVDIKKTPWNVLDEEVFIDKLEKPLFGGLRMPNANSIDVNSSLAMPIFSEAIEELKDLDVAYSRNAKEIFDSGRIVLLDSDRMIPVKGNMNAQVAGWDSAKRQMHLPDYVQNVFGNGTDDFYQEINPQLNTEERIKGINNQLSLIGFKCGFSNGYFVLDEKTGMITATQVESDDRRTIQLIKDVRDQLEKCLKDLVYALDKFADLYTDMPVGAYDITFDFGDITYNREEDRLRWWGYVQAGKVPAWKYFVKFEGMSEEEAKAMVDEAQPKEGGLFDEE